MVLARALGVDAGRDAVLARIFDGALAGAPARLAEFLEAPRCHARASRVTACRTRMPPAWVEAALQGVRGRKFHRRRAQRVIATRPLEEQAAS